MKRIKHCHLSNAGGSIQIVVDVDAITDASVTNPDLQVVDSFTVQLLTVQELANISEQCSVEVGLTDVGHLQIVFKSLSENAEFCFEASQVSTGLEHLVQCLISCSTLAPFCSAPFLFLFRPFCLLLSSPLLPFLLLFCSPPSFPSLFCSPPSFPSPVLLPSFLSFSCSAPLLPLLPFLLLFCSPPSFPSPVLLFPLFSCSALSCSAPSCPRVLLPLPLSLSFLFFSCLLFSSYMQRLEGYINTGIESVPEEAAGTAEPVVQALPQAYAYTMVASTANPVNEVQTTTVGTQGTTSDSRGLHQMYNTPFISLIGLMALALF
jgi:hypothetical protein